MSVRPVVRKQQTHWTDFHETGYTGVYFQYLSDVQLQGNDNSTRKDKIIPTSLQDYRVPGMPLR